MECFQGSSCSSGTRVTTLLPESECKGKAKIWTTKFFERLFSIFFHTFLQLVLFSASYRIKNFSLKSLFHSASLKTYSGNCFPSERNGKLKQNILYYNIIQEFFYLFLIFLFPIAIKKAKNSCGNTELCLFLSNFVIETIHIP